MKIIEVAREQRDILNEGIAYVAVWQELQKNGKKSWFTEDFYADEVNDCEPIFGEEELARLGEIVELDEQAILLNGHYDSWVGSVEEPLTAAQIAEGIKRHYELDGKRLKDYIPQADEVGETSDDVITVEIPKNGSLSDERFQNLLKLAESRRNLIAKALSRPLVINDCGDSVQFVFPHSDDVGIANIYGQFAAAMMKYVKRHQRVTATEREVENEKFSMRTFLVKLGMNGSEFSETRKWFSRNLSGNAAFLTDESRQRWESKHTKSGGDDDE